MNEMIIDPPVGPYSEAGDIEAWLDDLREMSMNDGVREAIAQAEDWLNTARKRQGHCPKIADALRQFHGLNLICLDVPSASVSNPLLATFLSILQ